MAAIWKGAITFGLVSIPVELRTADGVPIAYSISFLAPCSISASSWSKEMCGT